MIGNLMKRGHVLGCDWSVDAVFQIEGCPQFHGGQSFEPAQDQGSINLSARNQPIAMIAILQAQIIGRNRVPKFEVIQIFQPLFNILNIFKNNHANSVPDRWFAMQMYENYEVMP
jgi:hypothetical protein